MCVWCLATLVSLLPVSLNVSAASYSAGKLGWEVIEDPGDPAHDDGFPLNGSAKCVMLDLWKD